MLTVGTKVKIKNSLVEGKISGLSLNDAKTELSYLVTYIDIADKVTHSRYFKLDQIEVVV